MKWGRESDVMIGDKQGPVYKTRRTGRTGNELYEYFFWLLKAQKEGKKFECTYGKFPEPFHKLPMKCSIKKHRNMLGKNPNYKDGIPDYAIDSLYYFYERKYIRQLIDFKPSKVYDLVAHVRLDDVNNSLVDYGTLPLEYYTDLVSKLNPGPNRIVVGRPIDEEQEKVLNIIADKIGASVQHGTLSEDLTVLSSAKVLIGSTSTFWFFPFFISDCELYYPDFGVCKLMNMGIFKNAHPISVSVRKDFENYFKVR